MQDQIETIGMLIVKGVLLPIVGIAVTAASLWLPLWIKSKVKNESIAGVLERLSTLTFAVVTEVQQTLISGLGGKATQAELLAARDRALATVKAHLGPKGIKELMTVLGIETTDAFDKLVVTFIESAVHHVKTEGAVTTTTTTEGIGATTTTATVTTTEEAPKS
jgi:hypothetical protein